MKRRKALLDAHAHEAQMVPETQPEAALKLFTNFIFSQPF